MTREEVKQSLNIMLTNYNRDYDENIATLWQAIFINLDARLFKQACVEIIKENRFFPNANEVIAKYAELKQARDRETRERKITEHNRLISAAAAGQHQCLICGNTGNYFHRAGGYEYYLRCICARGRDLNRWGEHQINRGSYWFNPATKKYEDLYVADVNDALAAEDIEIVKAENMARKAGRGEIEITGEMRRFAESMADDLQQMDLRVRGAGAL